MQKINLKNTDITVYHETLKNGLNVFIVPLKEKKAFYTSLYVKYGAVDNTFIPYGKNDSKTYPLGIAHFLEHKLFEQNDGTDAFKIFMENGADANASTSYYYTNYLFSATSNIESNLIHLLNFVSEPHFTDENILKEQGIIEQELKMCLDDPYTMLYETSLYNTFINHPAKYAIGGTLESIKKITKETLYDSYNTFYNPKNMFLVITGNVSKKIINIIKENQNKKVLDQNTIIKITTQEPRFVFKEYDELIFKTINVPKVIVNFKICLDDFKIDTFKLLNYFKLYFSVKYGASSPINERLKQTSIISSNLLADVERFDNYLIISVVGESYNYNKLIDEIILESKKRELEEYYFENKKRVHISKKVSSTDSIYSVAYEIADDIINYNQVIDNKIDLIRSLNINELREIVEKLNLDNKTVTVLKNEKS